MSATLLNEYGMWYGTATVWHCTPVALGAPVVPRPSVRPLGVVTYTGDTV